MKNCLQIFTQDLYENFNKIKNYNKARLLTFFSKKFDRNWKNYEQLLLSVKNVTKFYSSELHKHSLSSSVVFSKTPGGYFVKQRNYLR